MVDGNRNCSSKNDTENQMLFRRRIDFVADAPGGTAATKLKSRNG
jgi:hypothetical protein